MCKIRTSFNRSQLFVIVRKLLRPFAIIYNHSPVSISGLFFRLSHFKFRIKMFLQKIFRGYSDEEIWNLNAHAALWILKRLIVFRNMDRISTAWHFEEKRPLTLEEWNAIIDEMIYYLLVVADEIYDIDLERYHKAKDLFAKYFIALWD